MAFGQRAPGLPTPVARTGPTRPPPNFPVPLFAMALLSLAQLTLAESETLWSSPRFFVAIFAGLVIALAFQLLLTNLSVATGATAAGTLTEEPDSDEGEDNDESSTGSFGELTRRANHVFGLWALLTGCIALFFGSWLGVELSLTVDQAAGATLGLVIWGLFYFAVLFVESSLIGTIVRTATSGLNAAGRGLGSVFSKLEQSKSSDTAAGIAAAVREEFLEDKRVMGVQKNLRKYLERLDSHLDPRNLRRELETMIGHTEVEAVVGDGDWAGEDKKAVTASLKTRPGRSETTVARAKNIASKVGTIVKEEAASDQGGVGSTVTGGLRAMGLSRDEAAEHRARFEEYLRSTDCEELDPEGIERDLSQLFEDPKGGWAALGERFASVDRSTFEALLTARGVELERAEQITGWAEAALRKLSGSASEGSAFGEGVPKPPLKERAADRLEDFLAEVDDPELRYEDVREEIEMLFDDPQAGASALVTRLKSLDRDALRSLLGARKNSSEEDAEKLIATMEEARDSVIARAEKTQAEVARRYAAAKKKTAAAAEETRKTIATAAWWACGSAAASAVAAALGGIVAVATGIG